MFMSEEVATNDQPDTSNDLDGIFDPMFGGQEQGSSKVETDVKADSQPQEQPETKEPQAETAEDQDATAATEEEKPLEEVVKEDELTAQDQGVFKGYQAEKKKRQAEQDRNKQLLEEIERLKTAKEQLDINPLEQPAPQPNAEILQVKMDLSLAALKRDLGKEKADELIQKWVAVSDGNNELIIQMNNSPDPAYFAKEYLEGMEKRAERQKFGSEEAYIQAQIQKGIEAAMANGGTTQPPGKEVNVAPTPDITSLGSGDTSTSYTEDGQNNGNTELESLLGGKF